MFEYKMVPINVKTKDVAERVQNKFGFDFVKYIEEVINGYAMKGWKLHSHNMFYNQGGSPLRAALIFEREKIEGN